MVVVIIYAISCVSASAAARSTQRVARSIPVTIYGTQRCCTNSISIRQQQPPGWLLFNNNDTASRSGLRLGLSADAAAKTTTQTMMIEFN